MLSTSREDHTWTLSLITACLSVVFLFRLCLGRDGSAVLARSSITGLCVIGCGALPLGMAAFRSSTWPGRVNVILSIFACIPPEGGVALGQ